jgi:hypothetical protein
MTIEDPKTLDIIARALVAFRVSETIKLEQTQEAHWHTKVRLELTIAQSLERQVRSEYHKSINPLLQSIYRAS